jgi:hypothetical protein
MPDYEKLYKIIFNGLTDAIECAEVGDYARAKDILIRSQQAAEAYYIEEDGEDAVTEGEDYTPLYILPHDKYAHV